MIRESEKSKIYSQQAKTQENRWQSSSLSLKAENLCPSSKIARKKERIIFYSAIYSF